MESQAMYWDTNRGCFILNDTQVDGINFVRNKNIAMICTFFCVNFVITSRKCLKKKMVAWAIDNTVRTDNHSLKCGPLKCILVWRPMQTSMNFVLCYHIYNKVYNIFQIMYFNLLSFSQFRNIMNGMLWVKHLES